MWEIISWIVVIMIVLVMVIPYRRDSVVKKYEDVVHPCACIDCNKASCQDCVLEGLNAEQADRIMSQITQQAIADNTIAYGKRFERRDNG